MTTKTREFTLQGLATFYQLAADGGLVEFYRNQKDFYREGWFPTLYAPTIGCNTKLWRILTNDPLASADGYYYPEAIPDD